MHYHANRIFFVPLAILCTFVFSVLFSSAEARPRTVDEMCEKAHRNGDTYVVVDNGQTVINIDCGPIPPGPSGGGGSTSGGSSGRTGLGRAGGKPPPLPEGTKKQCEDRKNKCLNGNMGDPKSGWSVDTWRKRIGNCFTIEDCNLQDTYEESQDGSDVSLEGACMYCLNSNENRTYKCTYDTPVETLCRNRRLEMNKKAVERNMDDFVEETLPVLPTDFIDRILKKAMKISTKRQTTTQPHAGGTAGTFESKHN